MEGSLILYDTVENCYHFVGFESTDPCSGDQVAHKLSKLKKMCGWDSRTAINLGVLWGKHHENPMGHIEFMFYLNDINTGKLYAIKNAPDNKKKADFEKIHQSAKQLQEIVGNLEDITEEVDNSEDELRTEFYNKTIAYVESIPEERVKMAMLKVIDNTLFSRDNSVAEFNPIAFEVLVEQGAIRSDEYPWLGRLSYYEWPEKEPNDALTYEDIPPEDLD